MTKLKMLTTISVLISAIASPVFAQDAGVREAKHHGRTHELRDFRGVYNQVNGPLYSTPRALDRSDINGFGFGGRDPSWVGSEDPSLNPAGN
jgi:hypothetical protein